MLLLLLHFGLSILLGHGHDFRPQFLRHRIQKLLVYGLGHLLRLLLLNALLLLFREVLEDYVHLEVVRQHFEEHGVDVVLLQEVVG